MEVTIRPISELKRRVRVAIEADEVEKKFQEQLKKLATEARLPGFREGKVPTSLIESRYGSGILEDVHQKKIAHTVDGIVEQHNLDVLHFHKAEITSPAGEPGLEFYFDVYVRPQFDLTQLDKLRILKPEVDDLKHSTESVIQRWLSKFGEPKEHDRPVQLEDWVGVEVEDLGSEFSEVGARLYQTSSSLSGEYAFAVRENCEDAPIWATYLHQDLLGKSVNEEFTVEKYFSGQASNAEQKTDSSSAVDEDDQPDDSPHTEFIKLHLRVKLKSIYDPQVPDLNEAFFAREEVPFANRDELFNRTYEQVVKDAESRQFTLIETQVYNQLMQMNPVSLPNELLDAKIREVQKANKDEGAEKELKDDDRQAHQDQLNRALIVEQYSRQNNIEVDQATLERALREEYQRIAWLPGAKERIFSSEYQNMIRFREKARLVVESIVKGIELETEVVSVHRLNSGSILTDYQDRAPADGPFEWQSPVSQEEIDVANEEERKLRAAAEPQSQDGGDEQETPSVKQSETPIGRWWRNLSAKLPFNKKKEELDHGIQ